VLRGLIDPLWLPLTALIAIWVVLWRRQSLQRWMKPVGTSALVALWLTATPFGAMMLERPLVTESSIEDGWTPDYIYVLSAGYDVADAPEEDSSGLETTRRVNRAARLWREYPTATLVMAGSQPGMDGTRAPEQQGLLMQAQAERLGVPTENIIIDSVSLNTNGHAKVARDSGLHEKDDPLAIVTSDFHLRRSRKEFRRYFTNIRMIGSDPIRTDDSFSDLSLSSFFPRVDDLRDTAMYLREYVALALSDLRN
jgi:uncharacterized SAM-binding protein YcdF (DUF218 family)